MSIQCLQRVLKRLEVLAELPDGTGEVARPCDEVAPSSIQGHACITTATATGDEGGGYIRMQSMHACTMEN